MSDRWDDERIIRLLEIDLDGLARVTEHFDKLRFIIKGWTVTLAGALAALGVNARNAAMPIIGLFVIFFLAYLEGLYMDMQVRVMSKSNEVARMLTLAAKSPAVLPDASYRAGVRAALGNIPLSFRRLPQVMAGRPELYMFYLGLMTMMAITAGLVWLNR